MKGGGWRLEGGRWRLEGNGKERGGEEGTAISTLK